MEKISLDVIKKELELMLAKQVISGRTLLDRFCLINEASRKSPPYVDPRYAPFYYYLGKLIKPKTMVEIGFDLGLLSSSLLTSCSSVEEFLGFKEVKTRTYFSNRIGAINIKKVCKAKKEFVYGEMFDKRLEQKVRSKKWDLILINEEKDYDKQLMYLEMMWSCASENAIMVVEYIKSHQASKEAFKSFVGSKDADYKIFDTRYGTGLVARKSQ